MSEEKWPAPLNNNLLSIQILMRKTLQLCSDSQISGPRVRGELQRWDNHVIPKKALLERKSKDSIVTSLEEAKFRGDTKDI